MFGIQVTPPAPILKALPKIFGHSDKTVRSEGTQLTHALYQWMGPGIETFLGDLKPVQVKELKEAFDAMEGEGRGRGTLKAERLTRAQAREKESNFDAEVEDEGNQEEGAMHLLCEFVFLQLYTPQMQHLPIPETLQRPSTSFLGSRHHSRRV